MEGMEVAPAVAAKDVRAAGQAALILEWMGRMCPDMVPMAPLLEEIMLAGFEETRSALCVLACSAIPAPIRTIIGVFSVLLGLPSPTPGGYRCSLPADKNHARESFDVPTSAKF